MKAIHTYLAASVAIGLVLFVPLTIVLLVPEAAAAKDAVAAGAVSEGVLQWAFVGAAVAAGMGTLGAGFAVAHVGSASVGALAEKPELLGRLLILVGLAEGIAIYGLIIAIIILNRAG